MPRAKCPDPALLQAYVDGTLFSRDVSAVEEHVANCDRCAAILDAMRKEQDAAAASPWSRPRVAGVALAVIAVAGIAAWALRSGSNDAPTNEAAPVTQPEPAATATPPPAQSPVVENPAPAAAPSPAPVTEPAPKSATSPVRRPASPVAEPPKQAGVKESPPAEASAAPPLAQADGGVIVRGGRRSNRRMMWRARDLTIERSSDGGTTWASEYTTDRRVRAGAFVTADVAWLVGDNGLVIRRTKNGWFGTTPPAEGNVTGIRASSASKATVTFEDGRAFATENGGVTWSSQ